MSERLTVKQLDEKIAKFKNYELDTGTSAGLGRVEELEELKELRKYAKEFTHEYTDNLLALIKNHMHCFKCNIPFTPTEDECFYCSTECRDAAKKYLDDMPKAEFN